MMQTELLASAGQKSVNYWMHAGFARQPPSAGFRHTGKHLRHHAPGALQ